MELNKEITEILREHKINVDKGILYLLAVYHNLEAEETIPLDVIRAIAITKIVEKDYKSNTLVWNIPLYNGQQTAFEWVKDWTSPFGKINPERKGVAKDCLTRMKKFFAANPEYRKEDVYKARDLYLATVKDPQYLKSPHKFIYEGAGDMRSSMLLQWCEKAVEDKSNPINNLKGLVK